MFVADLTICAESADKRLYPNSNVMFEYGYALKAKGRSKLICVMNAFYGGSAPTELPFDLRHARAPIRFVLAPDASDADRKRVFEELFRNLMGAARLILDNSTDETEPIPAIIFREPHFKEGEEIAHEGDYPGQINPTFFGACPGFIYLRGRPLKPMNLSIAQIIGFQRATAGLEITDSTNGGSYSTNKWGRISYALERQGDKRITCDYVQYFRTGEIEVLNGSYFRVIGRDPIHLDYLVTKTSKMLDIAKEWIEKTGKTSWLVEIGVMGAEHRRLTLQNFGQRGPLLHQDNISVQKKVSKDSIMLLADELRATFLAEVGV